MSLLLSTRINLNTVFIDPGEKKSINLQSKEIIKCGIKCKRNAFE